MFAIVVHEEGRPAWRNAYAIRDLQIGTADDNGLVLHDDRVSPHHARLVVKDGKYILVDVGSTGGTHVNGRKLVTPLVVRETDRLELAGVRLEIVTLAYDALGEAELVTSSDLEADLVDAIARGDVASRGVYADWLEGNGDHGGAELLRLQDELALRDDPIVVDAGRARMRELAAAFSLAWRARVLTSRIENCPRFAVACPKQWSELAATGHEGVRHCATCDQRVYYCGTIDEARAHAARGACVALDLESPRWDDDLAPPFGERVCEPCGLDVGTGLRDCPRCGARVAPEMMMLGRMA